MVGTSLRSSAHPTKTHRFAFDERVNYCDKSLSQEQ